MVHVVYSLEDGAYSIIRNARIKDGWLTSWLNIENLLGHDRNVIIVKGV